MTFLLNGLKSVIDKVSNLKWWFFFRVNVWLLAQKKMHSESNFNTYKNMWKKEENKYKQICINFIMINFLYTDSVYTFTIRCMTHNLNLNLKLKFCVCVIYPIIIVYTPSVYIRFTLIIIKYYNCNIYYIIIYMYMYTIIY